MPVRKGVIEQPLKNAAAFSAAFSVSKAGNQVVVN